MRSLRKARALFARLAGSALLLAALAPAPLSAQPSVPLDGSPGSPDIARALDEVKADPNLGTQRTIRTLRWKGSTGEDAPAPTMPGWLVRLTELIARSTRYLVWVGAFIAATMLAGYIVRMARDVDPDTDLDFASTPSHVLELDIRPESLPRDVGAAARDLWARGDQRAAVALLYRATLSRLVHAHGVPIRDSSTEGDCLRLCVEPVEAQARAYVSELVPVWQRLVYGHQAPASEHVLSLCDRFERALAGRQPVMAEDQT